MTTGFIKSRRTAVDLPGYVLAAFTSTRGQVTLATSGATPIAGVTDAPGGKAGSLVDLLLTEFAEVRAGGAIAPGDRITAGPDGRGVKAVKQAGATVHYVGFAQEPAVADDIIPVLIAPGAIDG